MAPKGPGGGGGTGDPRDGVLSHPKTSRENATTTWRGDASSGQFWPLRPGRRSLVLLGGRNHATQKQGEDATTPDDRGVPRRSGEHAATTAQETGVAGAMTRPRNPERMTPSVSTSLPAVWQGGALRPWLCGE